MGDFLDLPYFDFLACLGDFGLHPGGALKTQELLSAAQVRVGESILEIGCGVGHSTRLLLEGGARMTIVDRSPLMLEATRLNCASHGVAQPDAYCAQAEALTGVPAGPFGFVLYECVLGFVADKPGAVRECVSRCHIHSRVGVIDFHYVQEPPHRLQSSLRDIFGYSITPLFESDWAALFSPMRLRHWRSDLPLTPREPSLAAIRARMQESIVPFHDLGLSIDEASHAVLARLRAWEAVFTQNRRLMRVHTAVYEYPSPPSIRW